MSDSEIQASFLLSRLSLLTPAYHHALLTFYGSARAAVAGGPQDWRKTLPISEELIAMAAGEWPEAQRFSEQEMRDLEETGARVYLWQHSDYPARLREISAAPPIIYVWGNGFDEEGTPLALVGSRRPTYYGEKVARELTQELVEAGITTVSGLARGIDSHVHQETVKRGGTTWAILGSGLLNLYPRENRALAEKILERGALVSEFPLHAPPYRGHFPRRNRIIAGLSHATIVVEGDEKSGSLITARLAAEEGRDVFAVPGPVSSRLSRGPHRLIQSGAALVTCAEDIFKELPEHVRVHIRHKNTAVQDVAAPGENEEQRFLRELEATALSRDVLSERLKIPAAELASLILTLELQGLVRSLPGGLVAKGSLKI